MATYDFTGSNGDPLPAGLTARNGTFEIQSNQAAPTGADPSGPLWVFTGESQSDGTVSAVYRPNGQSGVSGLAVRYSDNSNMIWCLVTNGGACRIFEYISGSLTEIGTQTLIPSYNNTSGVYTLSVELSGTSIIFKVDGATRNSATSTHNQSATKHGVRLADTSTRIDDLSMPDASASNSIIVADAPKNNHVYQRGESNSKSVSFAVNYTGAPTALQYRLLDAADDATEITTWTTFDASPSGGTSTLTFTAPASTTGYHVEVRFSNGTGITDIQSLDWYVGANILIFGQSLAMQLNTDGVATPPSSYFVYDGTASAPPTTGTGANEIATIVINSENVAVCITNTGVSARALTVEAGQAEYWNDPTGLLWTDTVSRVNGMTAGANELEFAWWHQGTRDSLEGVTEAQYLSALNTFFPRVRSVFSGRDGSLKILGAILARDTRGTATDSSHQAIRDAQLSYYPADANAFPVTAYPIQTYDGVHGNDAGYTWLAGQVVATYYNAIGLVSSGAPSILSASIGDAANEIDLNFDSNLLLSDSAYSTEGVRVTLDVTPATVTGFSRKSATAATITLSENVVGDALVWLGYGVGSTQAQLIYPRGENAALPNAGGAYNITASSFSEQAITVASSITLNIGAPDGTYKVYLLDQSDNVVYNGNATFSGGSATLSGLTVAAGTALEGYTIDNESPHVNGAVITGVTV